MSAKLVKALSKGEINVMKRSSGEVVIFFHGNYKHIPPIYIPGVKSVPLHKLKDITPEALRSSNLKKLVHGTHLVVL